MGIERRRGRLTEREERWNNYRKGGIPRKRVIGREMNREEGRNRENEREEKRDLEDSRQDMCLYIDNEMHIKRDMRRVSDREKHRK